MTLVQTDVPVRYRLRQSFRYDYDGPVTDLLHRLVVVPPTRHGTSGSSWASSRCPTPQHR